MPCTAGKFWEVTTQTCTKCGENTISGDGATECHSCPTGIKTNQDNTQCGNVFCLSVRVSVVILCSVFLFQSLDFYSETLC